MDPIPPASRGPPSGATFWRSRRGRSLERYSSLVERTIDDLVGADGSWWRSTRSVRRTAPRDERGSGMRAAPVLGRDHAARPRRPRRRPSGRLPRRAGSAPYHVFVAPTRDRDVRRARRGEVSGEEAPRWPLRPLSRLSPRRPRRLGLDGLPELHRGAPRAPRRTLSRPLPVGRGSRPRSPRCPSRAHLRRLRDPCELRRSFGVL